MPESLHVIARGNRWVVIDKPAGIGVERHFEHDTVEKRALAQFRRPRATKDPFVGIVHRLDRPVSGVLLLARNKSTLVALNEAFAAGRVQKTYWTLVAQPPEPASGRLSHYLLRDKTRRRAVATTRPLPQAKQATLTYRTLATSLVKTLLEVKPISGRFHQIRVQLAVAGSPILGDELYGSDQLFYPGAIALHAHALTFPDPDTGRMVTVEAEVPEYW